MSQGPGGGDRWLCTVREGDCLGSPEILCVVAWVPTPHSPSCISGGRLFFGSKFLLVSNFLCGAYWVSNFEH